MPAGNCDAIASIAASASPEATPGAGSPWTANVGNPLNRSSFGEPNVQWPLANAENGTISPLRLRTYQRPRSSGFMRNGASACMYTRLFRPSSMKSLTYVPPHVDDRVALMSPRDSPSAAAFS
jgi:hypothetical protein